MFDIKFLKDAGFKVETQGNSVGINCDAETAKVIARNTKLVYVGTVGKKSLFTRR